MSIRVECPGCQKKLNAKDELGGKRARCPSCGQVLLVPRAPSASLQTKTSAQPPNADRAMALLIGAGASFGGEHNEYFDIQGEDVTDRQLEPLGQLSHLTTVNLLSCERITDGALKHLSGLRELELIYIKWTRLTGTGFAYLQPLTTLREIDAEQSHFSDEGLRQIAKFPNLETLLLPETEVTDEGLSYLADMHRLKALDLSGCEHITGEGLRHLVGCRKTLAALGLAGTSLKREALKHIKHFVNLEEFGFPPHIAGADLEILRGLTKLRTLPKKIAESTSPDRKRKAALMSAGDYQYMILDGAAGPNCQCIGLEHYDRDDQSSTYRWRFIWSPDSKHFAYVVTEHRVVTTTTIEFRYFVVKDGKTNSQKFTRIWSAEYSPDSRMLILSVDDGEEVTIPA